MFESSLSQRLNAEFNAREARLKAAEQEHRKEVEAKHRAVARFNDVCEVLRAHWEPKLAEFSKHFADMLKVTPTITPDQRQVQVVFLTDLANMTMSLTASLGADLQKVVIDYGLLITPMFFDYERSVRLEVPLDPFDMGPVERWVDDRLVACVRAYLTMLDNTHYLDRCSVEDPITKARFVRRNAAAHLRHKGQVVYFATEQSMHDYKKLYGIDDGSSAEQT